MKGGWFVGNFEPTAHKTTACEVSLKQHKKDEYWAPHYHKLGTEINLVVRGRITVQGTTYGPGEIFVMEPYDVADPVFEEDCEIVVVKLPSVQNDKYETE